MSTQPESSRVAFRGKLVEVAVETWDGAEREIVEHPGSVTIVAIDGERRVVLVRQFRFPWRAPLLEPPGGKLEPGEQPLASAQRELVEECGLRGGRWHELGRFW